MLIWNSFLWVPIKKAVRSFCTKLMEYLKADRGHLEHIS